MRFWNNKHLLFINIFAKFQTNPSNSKEEEALPLAKIRRSNAARMPTHAARMLISNFIEQRFTNNNISRQMLCSE